jgi:hypothetical protein
LIIGVQYCMNVVCVFLLIIGYNIVWMLSVVLLIIGVQYCMNVVFVVLLIIQYCTPIIKRTTDNIHTILYTYNQENYRQHSYNIVHLLSGELQTIFMQYCTPIIKRTTDNIHTILYTYNQENYRVWMLSVVTLIIGVQYSMNAVCSSIDYRCTILYECCLCCSLDYRCTILYECCL